VWSYASTRPIGVVLSLKKAQGQIYLYFVKYDDQVRAEWNALKEWKDTIWPITPGQHDS
jgi:hypothetical protein